MLKIFNTLTRQKEEFKPIHAGEVGMNRLKFLFLACQSIEDF